MPSEGAIPAVPGGTGIENEYWLAPREEAPACPWIEPARPPERLGGVTVEPAAAANIDDKSSAHATAPRLKRSSISILPAYIAAHDSGDMERLSTVLLFCEMSRANGAPTPQTFPSDQRREPIGNARRVTCVESDDQDVSTSCEPRPMEHSGRG